MNESNGRFLSWKWLTGILVGTVFAMTAFIINNLNADVGQIKLEHIDGQQRLQAVETANVDVQRRLMRIEDKVDKILGQ